MVKLKVITFGVLLLLLAACSQANNTADLVTPTPIPTPIVPERPTYIVQRGNIINTLEFTGRVSPILEQELFFRSDGFVDQIFVQRGERVQAGAVLAQLEIGNLENQLAQAQVALETAEIRLAKAEQDRLDALAEAEINLARIQLQLQRGQTGSNSAALVSAQIELDNARERLAAAEFELQKSLDREWEPEELRRQYERAVDQARDALAIAQARYNDALAAGRSSGFDREILQMDLQLAELRLAQLERGVDPLLLLDVDRVRLDVARIERQIADAQLIAPFAGEVLSVGIRAGSRAEAFRTVIVMAEPDELEITAELGREALNELSVGQAAIVSLRNRPGETYNGAIRQLPLSLTGVAAGVQESDTRTRITLAGDVTLTLGELVTVVIVLEEKDDVLWLPPAAIRSFQGRSFVIVQEVGAQRRLDVRRGIETPSRVEILEGVEEGQVVVGE
ncbi:MAG: HlyD family efflux transporter periplasmic adaptor subunit [Anaerolineae bacterium]|nr:HlyD family efflux transporter periplasmic adaptor subunit [Anaerolineae bacterium]